MGKTVRIGGEKQIKEITSISVTIRHSGWTGNDLAQSVRECEGVCCLTGRVCTSRVLKPFDIVNIEVPEVSNLGIGVLC